MTVKWWFAGLARWVLKIIGWERKREKDLGLNCWLNPLYPKKIRLLWEKDDFSFIFWPLNGIYRIFHKRIIISEIKWINDQAIPIFSTSSFSKFSSIRLSLFEASSVALLDPLFFLFLFFFFFFFSGALSNSPAIFSPSLTNLSITFDYLRS